MSPSYITEFEMGQLAKKESFCNDRAFSMVWKSNKAKDPLGRNLFPKSSILRPTRFINCVKAIQPVPGNNTLAANLMARAWNSSSELQTATTVGAARTIAQKWARNLLL